MRSRGAPLGPQGQPEDADEADRGGVVERVVRVVRGERPVVQRVVAPAAHDMCGAMVESEPDLAVDHPLRGCHVLPQVAMQRAEPDAVVGRRASSSLTAV